MRVNCTLNVGSLTGYAPTASPAFSGSVSFTDVSSINGLTRQDGSIKDLGLTTAIGNQLSFRAPLANPQFNGSVVAPLLAATSANTIMGSEVPTRLQIANTFTSYLTSSGATSLHPTKDAVANN